TKKLADAVNAFTLANHLPVNVLYIGSIFWISFSQNCAIRRSDQIDIQSAEKFKYFHVELLERGIYLGPSAYEVCFISSAHSDRDIEITISIMCEVLTLIYQPEYNRSL
ncbi:MAG: hypothetical protein ACK4IY_03950, partial [Chitinophagales bacterium]